MAKAKTTRTTTGAAAKKKRSTKKGASTSKKKATRKKAAKKKATRKKSSSRNSARKAELAEVAKSKAASIRASQRRLMARRRAGERDIVIPDIVNRRRRRKAERDIYYMLPTYFPERFYNPFTNDQKAMIDAILHAAKYGGDQAIAGPRGYSGKTTIAEAVAITCMLWGVLSFPLVVSKTGPDAKRLLANVKSEFADNDLLLEDYPEVCAPIRALEGAPQRAGMQTVAGQRTRIEWRDDHIILPHIEGSAASGAIFAARGGDGSLRGLNFYGHRPDLAIIDDPDTRESAESEKQTADRETVIEQDIAGLGGPGKRMARTMLCSLLNTTCIAAQYTDPSIKPSWQGRRFRFVEQWPAAEEMWKQYLQMRQSGQESGEDPHGREAHAYYLANREQMDAGAVVSNPHAFVSDELPDGTQIEASALEHAYNIIARIGINSFLTEYQNDPPEAEGPQDSGITSAMVARRLNGLPHRVCPRDTKYITVGVDLGQYRIHYTVIAWCSGAAGYVIDYGVKHVSRAAGVTIDDAMMAAMREFRDDLVAEPCATEDGEPFDPDLVFIDMGGASRDAAGNVDPHKELVYAFCKESGSTYKPFKGESPYRSRKPGRGVKVRHECHESYQAAERTWLTLGNSDYWKHWVHARFMQDPDEGSRRGTLTLFGDDPNVHRDSETGNYAKSIVAEVWRVQAFKEGKGAKEGWHKIHRENHFLDATYMACCAAGVLGIRLLPATSTDEASTVTNWFARQRGRKRRRAS